MKKTYTYVSRRGSKILCRGFYENGERYLDKVDYEPTLFISGKKTNEKPWHDIYGNKVYPVKPGSISDCKDFLDRYKDVEGFNVLGMTNWVSQYLSDEYNYEIHPDFNHTRVYTIDIETEIIDSFPDPSKANEEILLITVHDTLHDRYLVYGANKVNQEKVFGILEENGLSKDKVKFIITQDEYSMLKQFVIDWSNQYPDAITGWNTETFDIPFLVNRINRVLGEEFVKKLSPFGIVTERLIKRNNNEEQTYDIEGIAKLDYLDLMKKYTYGDRESWKLGDVAQDELGKTKLDFDCSFTESYQKYWDRFVAYNIIDVHLVEELDKKFKLIELAYTVAYMAKINPDEIFSPIRTWDSIIFNHLKSKGIVVPEQKRHKLENSIAGGFVKDPQMGKHEWIVSFDFASLYPSLMMFNNISPDTLVSGFFKNVKMEELLAKDYDLDYLKQDDVCMTANGVGFTKTKKGFVPELVEGYYDLRKKTKKEMLKLEQEYADTKNEKLVPQISSLNAKQMAVKILMNSLFGAMASPYFRFFDNRLAEGITLTGQLAIQWTANEINNFLNKACQTENEDYIIYIDTDSCYVDLKLLVEAKAGNKTPEEKIRFMEKFSQEVLQRVITKATMSLGDYINAFSPEKLQMKLEKACSSSVFVAKKRYALKVHSSEGVVYPKPKIAVTGLEIVRSSTPGVVKEALKKALEIIMEKSDVELRAYINEYKDSFKKYNLMEIAFPRGVNGLQTYSGNPIYTKGCPIHVRAALLYNHYIKKQKLESKYKLIKEGDKIRFIYLKMPNIIRENVIGFPDKLPEEFGLNRYIDYDLMFQKAFIDPLQNILEVLGWELEEKTSLEDFFG